MSSCLAVRILLSVNRGEAKATLIPSLTDPSGNHLVATLSSPIGLSCSPRIRTSTRIISPFKRTIAGGGTRLGQFQILIHASRLHGESARQACIAELHHSQRDTRELCSAWCADIYPVRVFRSMGGPGLQPAQARPLWAPVTRQILLPPSRTQYIEYQVRLRAMVPSHSNGFPSAR